MVPLLTEDGDPGDDDKPNSYKYEDTISFPDADKWHGRIAAYGVIYEIWLAPSRWTGKGYRASNGGQSVTIFPPNETDGKGAHIAYNADFSCSGCVADNAAPYFAKAREDADAPIDELPKGTQIKKITSKILTYSLPDRGGLSTKGVVFYGAYRKGDEPYFMKVELVLPADQPDIMEVLMKYYIEMMQ